MVVLPIISVLISGFPFGFASAPYDRAWSRRYPRRAAWMALAGPGANLALVLAVALLIRVGMLIGVFHAPDAVNFTSIVGTNGGQLWGGVAFLLSVFFSLNLVLLALNLIPVPPLDGSAAVPLFLSDAATEKYQNFMEQPMLGWIGLLIAWRIFAEIFDPVFLATVNLLYPEFTYS